MTKVQVSLHDGTNITVDLEVYDSTELTGLLNNQQLVVVDIGGLIVNKNAVKLIAPVQQAQA